MRPVAHTHSRTRSRALSLAPSLTLYPHQAYILRVQDPALAQSLKEMLRPQQQEKKADGEKKGDGKQQPKVEVKFKNDREAAFVVGDKSYQVCARAAWHARTLSSVWMCLSVCLPLSPHSLTHSLTLSRSGLHAHPPVRHRGL